MLAAVTNLSRVSSAFADGLIGCTPPGLDQRVTRAGGGFDWRSRRQRWQVGENRLPKRAY
jgi:hypothetical protein